MAPPSQIKARLANDVKAALRAGERERLAALRQLSAAIKQVEVDSRQELDDAGVLAVLDKQAKQRRESMEQFARAGRDDLVAKEKFELELIQAYLPAPLTSEAIDALIEQAISQTQATGMKDMGKVMGWLKPHLQGRADMAEVSARLKLRLGA